MKGLAADAPILVVTGGVDTWKMDVHGLLVALALMGVARVLTFDIAGTGESQVAMSADGGAEIAEGVVAAARARGLAVGRGAWLPKMEKPRPGLGGPPLETHVGRKQAS